MHPFMVDAGGYPLRVALDHALDPTRLGAIRLVVLARSALKEVLARVAVEGLRLDALLAAPETRPGFTAANAAWVAREVTAGITPRPVELSAPGHAGALDAVREAVRRIDEDRADLCAVIGVESYFSTDTVTWLLGERRLAAEGVRDGFVPGEAAGAVLLASPSLACRLGVKTLAHIRGAASTHEPVTIASGNEILGRGLTAAIDGAIAALKLPDQAVNDVYADLNGERYRTDEWGMVALRRSDAFRTGKLELAAHSWGDVGAAAGALGCVLAVRAWARDYAHGPRALVWGSSDGGLRSAVLLEEGEGAREIRRSP